MKGDLSQDLAKKILNFQILWGQWNKSVVNQVFNINGKGNSNLTLQQFIILMLVHRVDIKSVSQMACLLNLSKSSLSLTLSKMEKEGLLQKMPPPKGDDGRKVYLCVTQKGISALKESEQKTLQFFVEYCHILSQQQREDLQIGIEKLSGVLSKDS